MTALAACLLATVAAAGCGDDDAGAPDAGSADGAAPVDGGDCAAATVLYLNRTGGMYTVGIEDSVHNVSSVFTEAETVAPWAVDDALWADMRDCVAAKFAPFNVTVTDVDPSPSPHVEALFVGNPADLTPPFANGVFGIAPFSCAVIPNAIPLVNPALLGDNPTATPICEVTAQLAGNVFGLDHVFFCPDLMTYLSGCGDKSFVDMDVPCGENAARDCCTGDPMQNSYRRLLDALGPACP